MGFASEFIMNRFVDTKGTKINAFGERWVLVPASVIEALHRRLPEEALYALREKIAGETSDIKKRLGIDSNYLFAKLVEKGVGAGGWGRFALEDFDEKKMRGIASCENPPTAPGKNHLLRGMIAGFCEAMSGKKMEVQEKEYVEGGCRKIRFYATLQDPAAAAGD